MKNKLLLNIIFVLSLTSCGLLPQKNSDNKVLFYAWGNQTEIGYIQDMIDGFNATSDGVKVELERATSSDPVNDLKTRFSSGSEPDVFYMDPGELGAFVKGDYIEPLNSYLKKGSKFVEDDLWEFNDYYKLNENGIQSDDGQYYGFIKDLSPDFIMIYNKDMIDEYNAKNTGDHIEYPSETVPMTWYEFMNLAKKMTVMSGTNYVRYGTMVDYVPVKHLTQLVQQTGNSIFNEDKTGLNIDKDGNINEGLLEAFQYFYDLQVSSSSHTAPSKFINSNLISSADAFKENNVFSIWYGRWAFSAYEYDLDKMNIGFAPCPVPERKNNDASDNYGITSGMIGYSMSKRCKNKDAAYAFIEYAMTEGCKQMAQIGHNVPGNKKVAENEFCNVSNEKTKKLNQFYTNYLLKYTHAIDISPYIQSSKFDNIIFMELSKAYEGKQTLEKAIITAHNKIKTETSGNIK